MQGIQSSEGAAGILIRNFQLKENLKSRTLNKQN